MAMPAAGLKPCPSASENLIRSHQVLNFKTAGKDDGADIDAPIIPKAAMAPRSNSLSAGHESRWLTAER
ncbi:MAG: hypothetical protein ACRD3T_06375 [Terriglobia bacterium]